MTDEELEHLKQVAYDIEYSSAYGSHAASVVQKAYKDLKDRRNARLEALRSVVHYLREDALDVERVLLHLEQTRATLRRVCAEYGDNDWSDDLHLSDVIEKHLERHLG